MFREKVINHPKLLEVGVARSQNDLPYPSRLTGGRRGQGHGVVLHVQGEGCLTARFIGFYRLTALFKGFLV